MNFRPAQPLNERIVTMYGVPIGLKRAFTAVKQTAGQLQPLVIIQTIMGMMVNLFQFVRHQVMHNLSMWESALLKTFSPSLSSSLFTFIIPNSFKEMYNLLL